MLLMLNLSIILTETLTIGLQTYLLQCRKIAVMHKLILNLPVTGVLTGVEVFSMVFRFAFLVKLLTPTENMCISY